MMSTMNRTDREVLKDLAEEFPPDAYATTLVTGAAGPRLTITVRDVTARHVEIRVAEDDDGHTAAGDRAYFYATATGRVRIWSVVNPAGTRCLITSALDSAPAGERGVLR